MIHYVVCTLFLMTIAGIRGITSKPTSSRAASAPAATTTSAYESWYARGTAASSAAATAHKAPTTGISIETITITMDRFLTDAQFQCWPAIADAQRAQPFPSCEGVTAYWSNINGMEVGVNEPFNLSYFLKVTPAFYDWAVPLGVFDHAGPGFSNATKAREWCETTECPVSVSEANESNCCLHYVNLYFCPSDPYFPDVDCGPWMPAIGNLYTFSFPQTGSVTTGWWTSELTLREKTGTVKILAMFKLARMKIGLRAILHRQRAQKNDQTLCGNGECDPREDCYICSQDCGRCFLISWTDIIIAIVCVLVVLLLLVFLVIYLYRRKVRRELEDESWIVAPSEIFANVTATDGGDSKTTVVRPTDRSRKFPPVTRSLAVPHHRKSAFVRIPVAVVRGHSVVIKSYHNEEFQLTSEIRREVRDVRYLNHINVCQFVGGTVVPGTVHILYEFSPKGSLLDILLNDAICLNWAFRFSLLTDISRGMAYLHRHGIVHGNLKSSNCVVDDRWICKVTDFGLKQYRTENFTRDDEEEMRSQHEQKLREDRVYRAPETENENIGIPASDVYSFAIIMVEVATRERASKCISNFELTKPCLPMMRYNSGMLIDPATSRSVQAVKSNFRNSVKRGSVKAKKANVGFSARYQELINKCWTDKPGDRPDFMEVEDELLKIHPSKKNPVDTMMGLMQMYSKNLEEMVDNRSEQLLEEKHKTEALLYSILPRAVADNLRNGRQVSAEWFDDSTVFFSDIVGFTVLSARSTPMQVVELLNKLYTTFDSIIEKHKVYKVETIGDAYMVVSGVPQRTKNHAYYVAMMALDFVSTAHDFVIPHLPQEPLYIRIGTHSGPVCAGVVGVKMPRYCLFGDTVNTASRMESNSKAYRIHISNVTYTELAKHECFEFEPRGVISVKGKGDMFTWWLTGTNELPAENAVLEEPKDHTKASITFLANSHVR